nr:hypothetical protein [Tanacetum cinerariifolium]
MKCEVLVIYLVASMESISVVSLVERENRQVPIYFAIELGEHGIEFIGRNSVKGLILANFIVETPFGKEGKANAEKPLTKDRAPTSRLSGSYIQMEPPALMALEHVSGTSQEHHSINASRLLQTPANGSERNEVLSRGNRLLQKMGRSKTSVSITWRHMENFVWEHIICRFGVLEILISNNGKKFAEGHEHGHSQGHGEKTYKEPPRLVVPTEISMETERIKEFEARLNDKKLREILELLEERREIASIREAHYKQKLKRDGAYKQETLSGYPIDQTWNGSNLGKSYM